MGVQGGTLLRRSSGDTQHFGSKKLVKKLSSRQKLEKVSASEKHVKHVTHKHVSLAIVHTSCHMYVTSIHVRQ